MRKRDFKRIISIGVLLMFGTATTAAQTVVDKMLVTVSDGVHTELVTQSDILWQIALQPTVELDEPTAAQMEEALETVIDQKLVALEAERLPVDVATDQRLNEEIRGLVAQFESPAVFEARLRRVGFTSIADENFRQIIRQRIAIDNYLDFRFRSFTVVTPQDEEAYYKDVFTREEAARQPGKIVQPLNEVRERINRELTERKIAVDIERFLEEAKARVIVTTLDKI